MLRIHLLLMMMVAVPAAALGAEFLAFDEAIRLAFPDSGKVERFRPEVTAEQQQLILDRSHSRAEAKLGGIYVGHSAGAIDGIAFIDHVIGRTEFITWLCVLTPTGVVRRIEVMAYREPYGGEIRDRTFLAQFEGKDATSPLRAGREIANIAGATLSVHALTDRLRFLLAFHAVAIKDAAATWVQGRESPTGRASTLIERSAAIGTAALTIRVLPAGEAERAGTAADAALVTAARLDALLNAWKEPSELAGLNRSAQAVVSPELMDALELARQCHQLTGGRFDPSILPLLRLWQQAAERGTPPEAASIASAQADIGFARTTWDPLTRRVRLPAGVALDLSGLNKGLILDHLGRALSTALTRAQPALLAFGESSWLAVGDPAQTAPFLSVTLRHPADPMRMHQRIALRPGQGLGCASTSGRTFVVAGVAHSHLIDPISGQPAPLDRAATVLAPSAGLADGLDTALCLMAVEEGLALVAKLPGVSALIWDGARFHASPGWPGIANE